MAATANLTQASNGVSKPINAPSTSGGSPRDSVILDSSTEFMSHGEVPKSDALRQPLASLESRLRGSLDFWSSDDSLSQNIDQFLDYVAAHRLKHMPHKGGKWDKILLQSVSLTSTVHHYEEAVSETLLESKQAAAIIYACIHALLDLGPAHAELLEQTGSIFYRVSTLLTLFLRHVSSVRWTESIQQALAGMFIDLTTLIVDLTLFYVATDSSAVSATSGSAFQLRFGQTITSIESYNVLLMNEVWRFKLEQVQDTHVISYSVDQIRRFLSPFDSTVASIIQSLGSRQTRTEFTCEWFDGHLMSFIRSKDRNLLVSGKPGTGKSVLTDWIIERLERLQGAKATDVIYYKIQPDLVSETSSASVARGLLLQLLDLNVGNLKLLKALNVVLDMASVGSPAADIEDQLWRAVSEGFEQGHQATIVIDGLDHVSGGQKAALHVMERLRTITSTQASVKSIVLTCPMGQTSIPDTKQTPIESSHVQGDIKLFVQSLAQNSSQMGTLTASEQTKIIEQISVPAEGSFLWAQITFSTIMKQNTLSAILKSLETTARGVDLALEKLVFSLDFQHPDVRSLLAWMLAAERPLHLKEIKTLFELNPTEDQHAPRFSNTEEDVQKAVGDIVTVQDGYVRFIHSSVRNFLIELAGSVTDLSNSGKFPFMLKEAHFDIATRCMKYLKVHFNKPAEPTVSPKTIESVIDIFRDSPLLEYCVRYWTLHVKQSPVYQPDGKHKIVGSLKRNFSKSTQLAVMERTCWESQVPTTQLLQWHILALQLRIAILGNDEPAVLQTKLNLASVYKKLDERNKASDVYYEAYELSLKIYGRESTITVTCVTAFLGSTHSVKVTSINDTSKRLETTLLFIIEISKTSGRAPTEDIIKYSTMLAELYESTGQSEKAVTLWRTVYETSIEVYGTSNTQTTKSHDILMNSLKKLNRHDELARVQRTAYDRATKSLLTSSKKRHQLAVDLIKLYESQNNTTGAEEVLVDEWQSLSTAKDTSADFHKQKLDWSVQYVQFLKKQKRETEAQNILLGTWSEYKSRTDVRSEAVMETFVTLAKEMEQLRMIEAAHSVLLSVWNETKVSETKTTLSKTVAAQLIRTTEHIVKTKREIHGSDMTIEESIMEDIADTTHTESTKSIESGSTTTENTEKKQETDVSFGTTDSLSLFYLGQGRWTDAIRVCTKFLQKTWPVVLETTATKKITLPSKLQKEVITITTRLSECNFNIGNTVESERLLQSVFTATTHSLAYTDESVNSTSTTLIKFLESTHQFGKALKVHDVLYNLIKEKTGPPSEPTIHAAYQCAKYCITHDLRKETERYYVDIFQVVSKKSEILPEDALEAAQWLVDVYKRESRWRDARPIYPVIWKTVVNRGKQYHLTAEYISTFYSTYISVLRTHYEASYEQIRNVAVQYRETTLAIFGEEHELTLRAMFELAKVNEQTEKYREEATQLYKKLLTHTEKKMSTTSISKDLLKVIRETKKQVAQLMITSTTTTTSQEGVTMVIDEYQSSAQEWGHAHKSTLEQQRQVVNALMKEKSTESRQRVLQILEQSVVSIVSAEKDSSKLFESATVIARNYIEIGETQQAIVLLGKLRRQLIFDEQSKDVKIKLNRSDRASFAFVAAFELAIYQKRTFSEIMSELMTESMRYEAYHKTVKEKAPLVVVLLRGHQLLEFLERIQRKDEHTHVRHEILKIFKSYLGVTAQDSQLQVFFDIVLQNVVQGEDKSTIIQIVVDRVTTDLNQSRFQEAYELASLERKFIEINNELSTLENVRYGFNLAIFLSGRGTKKCDNAELAGKMLQMSKSILKLVLIAGRQLEIHYSSMSLEEVNMLAGLLGQVEMHSELEEILTEVWTSRHIQQTWTPSTIITLGRRLIEVRFAAGRTDAATHLCEDIIYNLRRVWGELDTTTLSIWSLLGELHSVAGNYHAAQNVYEEVLRQTLVAVEDGDITSDKAASIAANYMDLLKLAYQRGNGFCKDQKVYLDLQAQLNDEFGKEAAWKQGASSKTEIAKWTKGAPKSDVGLWKKPASWEFVIVEDSSKHRNNLRKLSGLFNGNGANVQSNGGGRGGKSYETITMRKVETAQV